MPNWKRLDVSTPPATNTSPSPALMAWAAMRIVCSDDEQYRFTVTPGRVEPGEERSHPGDVEPGLAAGLAAAEDHVLDLGRVELGDLRHDLA